MAAPPQYQTDAAAPAQGALLKLQPHGSTPPVNAYVTQSDLLVLKVYSSASSATVTLTWKMLLPDGRIVLNQQNAICTTARSLNTFTYPMSEGYLLEVAVAGGTSGQADRTFCQVSLAPGSSTNFLAVQVLCQGYSTFQNVLTWPNGAINSNTTGMGAVIDVTGTTPGAGAEINETIPTNAQWRLKLISFTLVTAVAVANRTVSLVIDDGANILYQVPALAVQAASLTVRYSAGDNSQNLTTTNGIATLALPNDFRMAQNWRIRTLTTNLQAADQYSAPQYEVEEYLVR
ncbi:MAG TPA: hypothetical protein VKT75_05745 [Acidobacteriaceae bacterium]|nr:hypothetical protein [Acidobacteriaceae bacterium]